MPSASAVINKEVKGFAPKGRLNLEAVRQAAANQKIIGGTAPADVARYVDTSVWEKAFGR